VPARLTVLLAAAALALVAGVGHAAASAGHAAPAFVVDTDVDFDDTAALAYLGEADRTGLIDLRAVTAEIDGFAAPGAGLAHTRCLLAKLGLHGIPTSDGDRVGPNPFPGFVRAALDPVIESVVRVSPSTPCDPVPTEGNAAKVLATAILSARGPVTVVTSGPLTNLAEALTRYPLIALKIDRVFVMGGGLSHGGLFGEPGFDNTQEVNFWIDPAAVQTVFRFLWGRVAMTGVDATDHVPLTSAFRLRLAADHTTPAAGVVYELASNALISSAEDGGGAFWWDPLNAVRSTVGGVVDSQWKLIDVVQSGPSQGRTIVSPHGSLVSVGVSADQARFEDAFIGVLNGRRPH
jgi:purine nucleosidase